jgi:hypothetical protein
MEIVVGTLMIICSIGGTLSKPFVGIVRAGLLQFEHVEHV